MARMPARVSAAACASIELTVPSDTRFRGTVRDLTAMVAERAGFAGETAGVIGDAVDQVVAGVIEHAFEGRRCHSIDVRFSSNNTHLDIGVSYTGSSGASSSLETLERELTARRPGNTRVSGMTLVRRVTDRVEFGRDGDRNFCRFVCRLPGGGS